MELFQRFSGALALSCALSYLAGAWTGLLLPLDAFWVALPVLYYGSVFFVQKSSHLFRFQRYRDSFFGMILGIWLGLFSIGKVNYEHATFYEGFKMHEVSFIEGILQQDGFQKGPVSILHIRVQSVGDRKGNRHSARFELTAFVPASGKFLSGDRVHIGGRFLPDRGGIFQGDRKHPPALLHRPFLTFIRSQILGNTFHQKGEHSAFLKALCFGMKDELEVELGETFRKSGTSHILALSGMHVGILVLLLQVLFRHLFKPLLQRMIISFFLVFYCILVGPFPSLVRAILMYEIYTVSLLLRRKIHPLDLLSYTFVLSCVLFPESVLSYSSILSYAAVSGIFLLTRPLQRYMRRFLFDPFVAAVSISLSAQILTAPLTLYFFSRLPLFGWLASVLLSPLVTLFMWTGVLSLMVGGIQFLDPTFQRTLEFLYNALLYVAEIFSQAPALQVP